MLADVVADVVSKALRGEFGDQDAEDLKLCSDGIRAVKKLSHAPPELVHEDSLDAKLFTVVNLIVCCPVANLKPVTVVEDVGVLEDFAHIVAKVGPVTKFVAVEANEDLSSRAVAIGLPVQKFNDMLTRMSEMVSSHEEKVVAPKLDDIKHVLFGSDNIKSYWKASG